MKYILYGILSAIIVITTGCSSRKNFTPESIVKNSVWVNFTPSELNEQKGVINKSIYFTDGDKFIMKTGVGQDSSIIAAPLFSDFGTYSCSGSLKKGISINLNPDVTCIGKTEKMEGLVFPEGMMLITPDGSESIYFKLQTKK